MTTKKSSSVPSKGAVTAKKIPTLSPLSRSKAKTDRDIEKLQSNREKLESEPPETDSDARASLL